MSHELLADFFTNATSGPPAPPPPPSNPSSTRTHVRFLGFRTQPPLLLSQRRQGFILFLTFFLFFLCIRGCEGAVAVGTVSSFPQRRSRFYPFPTLFVVLSLGSRVCGGEGGGGGLLLSQRRQGFILFSTLTARDLMSGARWGYEGRAASLWPLPSAPGSPRAARARCGSTSAAAAALPPAAEAWVRGEALAASRLAA